MGRRRSAADWQQVLAAYEDSGQSGTEFCQTNQIGLKSFYRAKGKYGSTESPNTSGFVQVTTTQAQALSEIELILPHARLRLDAGVSPVWVSELLKSLAA